MLSETGISMPVHSSSIFKWALFFGGLLSATINSSNLFMCASGAKHKTIDESEIGMPDNKNLKSQTLYLYL
jgi:hypothetical protein